MGTNTDFGDDMTAAKLDIARLQMTVEHQSAQLDDMRTALAELREQQKALMAQMVSLNTTLAQARGGWQTLMLVGGATATLIGAVVGLVALLKGVR